MWRTLQRAAAGFSLASAGSRDWFSEGDVKLKFTAAR